MDEGEEIEAGFSMPVSLRKAGWAQQGTSSPGNMQGESKMLKMPEMLYAGLMASLVTAPVAACGQVLFFSDDFELDRGWSIFEEVVAGNACYGTGLGEVVRSGDQARSGQFSLRVWANRQVTARNNHVLARIRVSDHGISGLYVFTVDAMIPAIPDTGQTGPEFSVQNTRDTPEGPKTFIAGIQYVGNRFIDEGRRWQIWHEGSWQPFWRYLPEKGRWYRFVLRVDFEQNRYVDLHVVGAEIDTLLDLSAYRIVGEDRGFLPAVELTLEAENLDTCSRPRPTTFRMYYDNVQLWSIPVSVRDQPLSMGRTPLSVAVSPNPITATATIRIHLSQAARLRVVVRNRLGRRVAVLADDVFAAGTHRLRWSGTDAGDRPVAAGVYFLECVMEGRRRVVPIVMLK